MIRRLITHGCSFTYGEELADPALSCWPRLVADHFGLELINLAKPAYSNDLMMGDIVDTKINHTTYHDLVIIAWTSHARVGLHDSDGWFTIRPNARDNQSHRYEINQSLVKHLEPNWLLDRWLQQVILMQSYLENRHAAYLFMSAFDNLNSMSKKRPLVDMVRQRNFVGWPRKQIVDMIHGTPLAPRGHPSESGHRKVADEFISQLQGLYGMKPKN